MLSQGEQKELQYFLATKQQYLVVSFLGPMNKDCAEILGRCENEIIESKAKFVVVTFHDVQKVDRPVIPMLVRIQKHIRDSKMNLRLCHIPPEIRKLLYDAGAIRIGEVAENLQDALYDLAINHKMAV